MQSKKEGDYFFFEGNTGVIIGHISKVEKRDDKIAYHFRLLKNTTKYYENVYESMFMKESVMDKYSRVVSQRHAVLLAL